MDDAGDVTTSSSRSLTADVKNQDASVVGHSFLVLGTVPSRYDLFTFVGPKNITWAHLYAAAHSALSVTGKTLRIQSQNKASPTTAGWPAAPPWDVIGNHSFHSRPQVAGSQRCLLRSHTHSLYSYTADTRAMGAWRHQPGASRSSSSQPMLTASAA